MNSIEDLMAEKDEFPSFQREQKTASGVISKVRKAGDPDSLSGL